MKSWKVFNKIIWKIFSLSKKILQNPIQDFFYQFLSTTCLEICSFNKQLLQKNIKLCLYRPNVFILFRMLWKNSDLNKNLRGGKFSLQTNYINNQLILSHKNSSICKLNNVLFILSDTILKLFILIKFKTVQRNQCSEFIFIK